MPLPPEVRLLTAADLDGALALSTTAGWNQRLDDWRMLLQLAPAGSFGAVSGGRLIGTAIGIDYGQFGWIAMMLVDPAFRGHGLGARLLEAAMDALPPAIPIRLDATPLGRPLYQRFGFLDEAALTRYVWTPPRRFKPPDVRPGHARHIGPEDLTAVARLDRQVFGGDRRMVLDWALAEGSPYPQVVEDDSGTHYCLGRAGRLFDQVGPVVATDEALARTLVAAALEGSLTRSIVIDAYDAEAGFTRWLARCGFEGQRPLFRMCRRGQGGLERHAGGRAREFAIFGPEFA